MLIERFAPQVGGSRIGFEHLIGTMDGAPKDGLFAAKIGFHTEMLLDRPPTLLVDIKKRSHETSITLETDLRHLLFRFGSLPLNIFRVPLLSTKNQGVEIHASIIGSLQSTSAFLNTDEDDVYFVHEGAGVCYTVLGGMTYCAGDFIFIPRHFHYRFRAVEKTSMIGIGSSSVLRKTVRKEGDNTDIPYDNSAVSVPSPNLRHNKDKCGGWLLLIKRGGEYYRAFYHHPNHCIAYKSTLYPFIVNASQLNFSYVTSIHADPTNFCLFGTADDSAMISVLGPRFVHSLPYNHLNEWDEFLFYAKPYGPRAGLIKAGDATLHPQGIWHGPQIPALMNWKKPERPVWVDDLAIMFESREPLLLCEAGKDILVSDYEKSWKDGWGK